ncbi:MAG TPA: TonB-dependent receptor, partial [Flavitalea sp.]|nr:TonB-dependent receptor [Flavitalea sp.]
MKQILVAVLFIMSSLEAFSQVGALKINGTILEGGARPLEGATITLMRKVDSSVVKISVSDKAGRFELDNLTAHTYFIQVTAVGLEAYNSSEIELSAQKPVVSLPEIHLAVQAASMGAVTVVAKRPLIEMRADRTVVNVEAAVTNVGATALEVLEKSPGISVDRDGNVSLKGRAGVLILVDGKQTYLSGADLASMLKGMSASELDQVEIMTNPPAKYDAAGNSGVINIKTKKNKQKGFNGNLSLSYGQGFYWKTNNSINLNYRNAKFNVFMNYSMNSNKGFSDLHILRTYYAPDNKTVTSIFEQPTYMNNHGQNNSIKTGIDYYLSKKTTVGIVASGFINKGEFNANSTGYLQDNTGHTDSVANTLSTTQDKWKNGSVNL